MAALWWTAEWSLLSLSLQMSTMPCIWFWKIFVLLLTKPWTWILISTPWMWNQVIIVPIIWGFLVESSNYSCVFSFPLSQSKSDTYRKKKVLHQTQSHILRISAISVSRESHMSRRQWLLTKVYKRTMFTFQAFFYTFFPGLFHLPHFCFVSMLPWP